jgi:hypothetical protein
MHESPVKETPQQAKCECASCVPEQPQPAYTHSQRINLEMILEEIKVLAMLIRTLPHDRSAGFKAKASLPQINDNLTMLNHL